MFDQIHSTLLAAAYFAMGWRFYTRILPAMDLQAGRSERSVMIWLFATMMMLFGAAWLGRAYTFATSSVVTLMGHYALLAFSVLYYRRMLRRTDGGGSWLNDGELP